MCMCVLMSLSVCLLSLDKDDQTGGLDQKHICNLVWPEFALIKSCYAGVVPLEQPSKWYLTSSRWHSTI